MENKKIKILGKKKSMIELKDKTDKAKKSKVNKRQKEINLSEKVNFKKEYYKKDLFNYDKKNINKNSNNEKTKNKDNYNKLNIYIVNKHILFYINFIILILFFLKKYNSSKIELTISGPGISKIFNAHFIFSNKFPN